MREARIGGTSTPLPLQPRTLSRTASNLRRNGEDVHLPWARWELVVLGIGLALLLAGAMVLAVELAFAVIP
jgi:hypothetical protein